MANERVIKNVVFDVGNVLVYWVPYQAIKQEFPEVEPESFFAQMRDIWFALNLGQFTAEEAINLVAKRLELPLTRIRRLFHNFLALQTPIPGSLEILQKLAPQVALYALTDNVREMLAHHRQHSQFLSYFKGVVASCDVGYLKPDPRIFQHLLTTYGLKASESVFIDDLHPNVEAAAALGFTAWQFQDAADLAARLGALGFRLI